MSIENQIISTERIREQIFTVRGMPVMLDSDLATIYEVETKVFNQAVKRNEQRFPAKFRFQITQHEYDSLRSQIVTLKNGTRGQHRKYLPYVFTEQGVAMLSAVLRSKIAIEVSIKIIDAFVEMRRFIQDNAQVFARLDFVERRQIGFETETGKNFEGVLVTIYTKDINKQLRLDLQKHNAQYPGVEIKKLSQSHDRFLIIDDKQLYHFGASLKDLGKKWFAFSKMNSMVGDVLKRLESVA
jgi:hypothetical protein